jgi:hypothetical protein
MGPHPVGGDTVSIEDEIRYEPTEDDLYEERLRQCRARGHDDWAYETESGLEGVQCSRCGRRMEEVVA